jgi:hypothetical protein
LNEHEPTLEDCRTVRPAGMSNIEHRPGFS